MSQGNRDLPHDRQPKSSPVAGDQTVHDPRGPQTKGPGPSTKDDDSAFDLEGAGDKPVILGDYVLLERIGAGGMGQVYKAQHRRMDRIVALKVLPRSTMRDPDAVQRFNREMRAAAKLFHPNIVTAFDAGEQNGVHYLVMEYVAGLPLTRLIETRGPLPLEEAVSYAVQAARGLQYAHIREVMHRDIKPSNLILTPDRTVKILDMGTARFADHLASDSSWDAKTVPPAGLTHSGVIIGTVDYMAPEQARDARSADHRADIYSLGCTLCYLLTARPVYSGDLIQTLLAHAQQPCPSLCRLRQDVPEALDKVFQKMLAKDPENRYQSMAEVILALEDCGVNLPATPPADTGVQRAWNVAAAQQPTARPSQTLSTKLRAVGIDLGTSHSIVAQLDATGRPMAIPAPDGATKTPSALMIEGMEIYLGKLAIDALEDRGKGIAVQMKRCLGRSSFRNPQDQQNYPPEALLGMMLNKLANDARAKVGEVREVVVSVPASFDEVRRKAVQDAAYIAGLEVTHLCNEPTAAAIYFAHQQGFIGEGSQPSQPHVVLVFHLGGGSFDVSVIEISRNQVTTLATDGDMQLGGRDWDQRLLRLMADEFLSHYEMDPRQDGNSLERLYRVCEAAKVKLTREMQAALVFDMNGRRLRGMITRDKFKEETEDLVERLAQTTHNLLRTAGVRWRDLSYVLLTGGATRTAGVPEMLRRLAGDGIKFTWLPDEAVARGVALQAGARLRSRGVVAPLFDVREVSSHSLGVVGIDPGTRRRHNAVLIPRNTSLPATTQRVFKTGKKGQDSIVLHIVQGDRSNADDCTPIGKCIIGNLPPDLPAGSPVTVEFHYSASGRLTVFLDCSASGQRLTKEIERAAGLSPYDLQRWREWAETMVLCASG